MKEESIVLHEQEGSKLLVAANDIQIVDEITRTSAAEFLLNAKGAIRVIEDEFKPDIKVANDLHKSLLARMKKLVAPFKQAQGVVETEVRRDYGEQLKLQRAEEARIRKEQAEADHLEQEKRDAEINDAVEAGNIEEAEEIAIASVEAVVPIQRPQVAKTVKSVTGSITMRKDVLIEVVDKELVIDAVAAGVLPSIILDVNLGAAKKYVKSIQATELVGFEISEFNTVAGRRN